MNLEPCPFCDCPDYLEVLPISNVGIHVTHAVVCANCGTRGPIGHSEDQASLHWASRRQQPRTLVDEGVGYSVGEPATEEA